MKDIIINRRRQRLELLALLVCFVIAFGLNVYAIIAYDGKWSELFWSLGFVVATTIVLYIAWTILRLLFWFCRQFIKKD
ncbi:MAG: hypothetical protein IJ196_05225 [Prevotella sp.]|nr:hypothetical protein [Prevotella sp.]